MPLIPGTNVQAAVVPNDSNDVFATHLAKYGQGGLRTVETLAERDAITLERREWLMEVSVLDDGKKYTLTPGTDLADNANWAEVVAGSGGPAVSEWKAGPQTANSLVLFDGNLYRVKSNIANGQATPAGNTQYYQLLTPTVDVNKAYVDAADQAISAKIASSTGIIFVRYASDLPDGVFDPVDSSKLYFAYDNMTLYYITSVKDSSGATTTTRIKVNQLGVLQTVNGTSTLPVSQAAVKKALDDLTASGATKAYVDAADQALQTQIATEKNRIDTLVTGAPQALDTLKEIADQLAADEQGTAAILATQQQHTQALANVVHRTGDETIAGSKTFTNQLAINYANDTYADGLVIKNTSLGTNSLTGLKVSDANGMDGGILQYIPPGFGFTPLANTVLFGSYGKTRLGFVANSSSIDGIPQDIYFTTLSGKQAVVYVKAGADDKVGIGTNNPSEKLEVAGNVKATQFIGDGSRLTGLPTPDVNKAYVDAADAALSAKIASATGIIFLQSEDDFPSSRKVDLTKLYFTYSTHTLYYPVLEQLGGGATNLSFYGVNQAPVLQTVNGTSTNAVSQNAVKVALDAIKQVIPATASSSNQLVVSNDSRLQDLARGFVDFQNEGEIYEESYVSNGGIFTANFPLKTGYAFRLNRHANTVGPFADIALPNPGYSGSYVLALRIPVFVTATQNITSAKVFNNTNQLLTTLVPGATVIVRGQFGGWTVLFSTSPADVNKAYVDAADAGLQTQITTEKNRVDTLVSTFTALSGNTTFGTDDFKLASYNATTALVANISAAALPVGTTLRDLLVLGRNTTLTLGGSNLEIGGATRITNFNVGVAGDTGKIAIFQGATLTLDNGKHLGAIDFFDANSVLKLTGNAYVDHVEGNGTIMLYDTSSLNLAGVASTVTVLDFRPGQLTNLPQSPQLVKVYLDGVDNAIYYNLSDGSQVSQSLNDYAVYFRGLYAFTDQSEIDNAPATPIDYTTPLAPALARLQKQITANAAAGGGAGAAPVYRGAYFDIIQAEFSTNPQPSVSWNFGDVVSVDISFQSTSVKGQSTLFKCIQTYVDNDPNSVQRPDTSPDYWEVLLGPGASSPGTGPVTGAGTPTVITTSDPFAIESDGEQYIYLPNNLDGVISILVSEAAVNGFSGVRQLYPTDYSAGGNRVIINEDANLLTGDEVTIVYYTNGTGGGSGSGGHSSTPTSSSTLEFVFNAGFADDFTTTIGSNQAGTYATASFSNVDDVQYLVNGTDTGLPLTLALGDTFQVVIKRQQAALGAVVTLTT